jgi:hypothetical protein
MLDRWDRKAALPVLRALRTQALEVIERDRSEGHHHEQQLEKFVARFNEICGRAGE